MLVGVESLLQSLEEPQRRVGMEGRRVESLLQSLEESQQDGTAEQSVASIHERNSVIADLERLLLTPASVSDLESLQRVVPGRDMQCAICLRGGSEVQTAVQFPCLHQFCEECAQAWLAKQRTCPLCRKQVYGENGSSPALEDSAEEAWWRHGASGAAARLNNSDHTEPDSLLAEAVAAARHRRIDAIPMRSRNFNTPVVMAAGPQLPSWNYTRQQTQSVSEIAARYRRRSDARRRQVRETMGIGASMRGGRRYGTGVGTGTGQAAAAAAARRAGKSCINIIQQATPRHITAPFQTTTRNSASLFT